MTNINDKWGTPTELVNWINKFYGDIALDVCCDGTNQIANEYISENEDCLTTEWDKALPGSLVWCNPPYSNPKPFVFRCHEQAQKHGLRVLMVLNIDPSTAWFKYCNEHACRIMPIVGGRIKFIDPQSLEVATSTRKPQVMIEFAPFGWKGKPVYDPVNINKIYPK